MPLHTNKQQPQRAHTYYSANWGEKEHHVLLYLHFQERRQQSIGEEMKRIGEVHQRSCRQRRRAGGQSHRNQPVTGQFNLGESWEANPWSWRSRRASDWQSCRSRIAVGGGRHTSTTPKDWSLFQRSPPRSAPPARESVLPRWRQPSTPSTRTANPQGCVEQKPYISVLRSASLDISRS